MDHLDGRHVWGQLAKPSDPTGKQKYPALLLLQWASPPYPLQKAWVTDRAAEGWLTLNIEPHDVMPDQPKEYYDALPQELKNYNGIETRNRDKNYFLFMYLADLRAADYLASRKDWDGKTLVVMGTSMGGQQSLCTAGLHQGHGDARRVPAGAARGTAHGRKPAIMGTPTIPRCPRPRSTRHRNCAARIRCVAGGVVHRQRDAIVVSGPRTTRLGPKQVAPCPNRHITAATPEQVLP